MGGEALGGLMFLALWLGGVALCVGLLVAAIADIRRKYTLPVLLLSSVASWVSAGGFSLDQFGNRLFPPAFILHFMPWALLTAAGVWAYYQLRRRST